VLQPLPLPHLVTPGWPHWARGPGPLPLAQLQGQQHLLLLLPLAVLLLGAPPLGHLQPPLLLLLHLRQAVGLQPWGQALGRPALRLHPALLLLAVVLAQVGVPWGRYPARAAARRACAGPCT
jgi:hypothetical protein